MLSQAIFRAIVSIRINAFLGFLISIFLVQGLAAQVQPAGNALRFGGLEDYVEVGQVNFVDASNPSGSWTIEGWFRRSEAVNYENLLHTDFIPNRGNNGIRVELNTGVGRWGYLGKLYAFGLGGGYSAFIPSNAPFHDEWYHLAIVGNRTNEAAQRLELYLNGVKVTDRNVRIPTAFANFVMGIGFLKIPNRDFNGDLDELRIWKGARSATEIQRDYTRTLTGTEAGLLYYFDFEEGTANGDNTSIANIVNKGSGTAVPTWKNFDRTSGSSSNYVPVVGSLSPEGLPMCNATTVDEFLTCYGGADAFSPSYISALRAVIGAEDDIRSGNFAEARTKLNGVWASLPIGGCDWNPLLNFNKGPKINTGQPPMYAAMRMLDDIVTMETTVSSSPVVPKEVVLRVLLVERSSGLEYNTVADLSTGGGPGRVTADLDPRISENDYAIVRQSLDLFARYIKVVSQGYLSLDIQFYPIAASDLNLEMAITHTEGNNYKIRPINNAYQPIWDATNEIKDQTDWWYMIYPSLNLEDDPNPTVTKAGFDNLRFVSGGVTQDADGRPFIFSDDRFLIRKPADMGYGIYSDIERRVYMPQFFQHEFFHHLFGLYPGETPDLEPTSHDWTKPGAEFSWPTSFNEGENCTTAPSPVRYPRLEADYFHEALFNTLHQRTPSLAATLRHQTPGPTEFNNLAMTQLVGSYTQQTTTAGNNPLTVDLYLATATDKYMWKYTNPNAEGYNTEFEVGSQLPEGKLLSQADPSDPVTSWAAGKELTIKLRDERNPTTGNYTGAIEGIYLSGTLFQKN